MNDLSNLGEGWTVHQPAQKVRRPTTIFAELLHGYKALQPKGGAAPNGIVMPVSLALWGDKLVIESDSRGFRHFQPAFGYLRAFVPLAISVAWSIGVLSFYIRQYHPFFRELPGEVSVFHGIILGLSLFVMLPLTIANAANYNTISNRVWRFETTWSNCNPIWFTDPDFELLAIRPHGRHSEPAIFLLPPKSQKLRDWPLIEMRLLSNSQLIWRFKSARKNFRPHKHGYWIEWWIAFSLFFLSLFLGTGISSQLPTLLSRNIGYLVAAYIILMALARMYSGFTELATRWSDSKTANSVAKWIKHLPTG